MTFLTEEGISDTRAPQGLLAILSFRAFRLTAGAWAGRHGFPPAELAAAVYGSSDEWHQLFVPFRRPRAATFPPTRRSVLSVAARAAFSTVMDQEGGIP